MKIKIKKTDAAAKKHAREDEKLVYFFIWPKHICICKHYANDLQEWSGTNQKAGN